MYGDIRRWVQQLPVGELFGLDDVQSAFPDKSRDALKMALGRLCRGDDPLVARACRGVYGRRRVGARYPTRLPAAALSALSWRVAGPGAGITGPAVINQIGWSTQVSPRPWVAVVGRPPRCPESGAEFVGRSNTKRLGLRRWEVSLLEAVRCFDDWAEMPWDEALEKFSRNSQRGYYGDEVRSDLLLEAAEAERGLGPDFLPRCRALAAAADAAAVR